jgi:hypothetical protein
LYRKTTLLFFFVVAALNAAEFNDGPVRLVIHEKTGRFSVYGLTDSPAQRYEAFFNSKTPLTSFLAVNVGGINYRLGESLAFRTRVESQEEDPAVVFESSFLRVTEAFSFAKTAGSQVTNGIKITVQIENKRAKDVLVGSRMLIDLNERRGEKASLIIEKETVTGEAIVQGAADRRWWIFHGDKFSLMGNIISPEKSPDFLHFANWRKLNNASWKAPYSEGRSFDDAAVCYYYEPEPLSSGGSFTFSIFLTAEDPNGFVRVRTSVASGNTPGSSGSVLSHTDPGSSGVPGTFAPVISEHSREADMRTLREHIDILNQFIAGKVRLNDEELNSINRSIEEIKARHGL